ncbi:cache domain-containing protein, partial [Desulfovibrio sp. OttesenSCG-928-O18]|nr:cache domain-containing protein [Desulfovibrio sp. OttesenSCG-928-O18]
MRYIEIVRPYYRQLLFVVLAFTTMVGVSFWYVKDIVQQQTEMNGNAAMDSANATIRSLLAETEVSLINVVFTVEEMISRGESQESVLEHITNLTDWYYAKAQRYFAFNGIYGYIRGEYLDGAGWVPPDDYNPVARPWYVGAIKSRGQIHYTDPYVDADTGKVIISTSQQVFTKKRQISGVVSIDFDITAVAEYIKTLHPAGGGYGFLLNDKMELVA